MSKETGTSSWISRHVHFDGALFGEDADRVLLNVVEPFVHRAGEERLLESWFFIRYGEFGNHIRLRVLAAPSHKDRLDDILTTLVNDWASLTVRKERYVPELERYGGPGAMWLGEQIFHSCSVAALSQLKKIDAADRSGRLAKALLSQLILLHVFAGSRDAARHLAGTYCANYLQAVSGTHRSEVGESFEAGFHRQEALLADVVRDVWRRLDDDEPVVPELDALRDRLLGLATELFALCDTGDVRHRGRPVPSRQVCLGTIVPSYIHMMNNRVGVPVIEEAFLAHLTARCLS